MKILRLLTLTIIIATFFSSKVSAGTCTVSNTGVNLGECYQISEGNSVQSVFPDLATLVSTLLPNLLILAAVILFFLLVFGGFTIVSGGGNAEQVEKGKQTITGAIIGFIVIFASYWVIQLIEMITGIQILNSTILN